MKRSNSNKSYPNNKAKQAADSKAAPDTGRMAITPRGLKFLLIGLVVMVSGYILMMGGGSKDPAVFNYAMFNFQRLVAAPLLILMGIIIEIVAILGVFRK